MLATNKPTEADKAETTISVAVDTPTDDASTETIDSSSSSEDTQKEPTSEPAKIESVTQEPAPQESIQEPVAKPEPSNQMMIDVKDDNGTVIAKLVITLTISLSR